MSQQETETVMRTYLDALLTGGDFGASFADDVVWTTMETGDEVKGREAVVDLIVNLHRRWFEAAPELGQVVFGDGVAGLEAVFVATHTGEFMGIPPTGDRVRLPYAVFYDVADGSITALHAYFPITALAQQLAAAGS